MTEKNSGPGLSPGGMVTGQIDTCITNRLVAALFDFALFSFFTFSEIGLIVFLGFLLYRLLSLCLVGCVGHNFHFKVIVPN